MWLRTCVGLLQCRAHVHRLPCIVCEAAGASEAHHSLPNNDTMNNVSGGSSVVDMRPRPDTERVQSDVHHRSDDGATTIEWRQRDMERWMSDFPLPWGDSKGLGTARLRESWNKYCDPHATMSEEIIEGAVAYLDHFCERQQASFLTQDDERGLQEDELIDIPLTFCIPSTTASSGTDNMQVETVLIGGTNAFLDKVKDIPGVDIEKQARFQQALLEIQDLLLNKTQLPFFLACGTALGAAREGHFIPYDEDIDIGVFYEDLITLGLRSAQKSPRHDVEVRVGCETSTYDALHAAQTGLVQLVSDIALGGRFLIFDICGEVGKGLEVRLLHLETNVRIDCNVYYPPILPDDERLIEADGSFIWTASFYEEAEQRKHRMYRYRHKPFKSLLRPIPFCAKTETVNPQGCFTIPPESYMEEYFGSTWRSPRQYSYVEGLKSEYKNIIEE